MKNWMKPVVIVQSMDEVIRHIQVNATTCLNRFIR